MNFKEIHIGKLLQKKVKEEKIEISRICNFFNLSERDIDDMYQSISLDINIVLKWSKLLQYDFFRLYSQHLILYAPKGNKKLNNLKSSLPSFRKNIYTTEIIDFILTEIKKGEKTKQEIVTEYKIPKTTLHKWMQKYQK
ncbi:transposase [Chryseobacterium bernardetii]|uniref:transposase n=1 Tax=Chryseobacterium bernardetii TaxID=1241978 RepID=UPI000F515618|nr:transposase [Chryseobacterium bernardetii]AZB35939.1 transposase [Chryseobacterium bernardetii]